MKTLIKTLTVSIYPKRNDQLILKHQTPTPKLQTRSELKCLKTLINA